MWKYGSTLRKTSSRRTGTAAKNCCWFAVRLRCVSITPFGKPVVPLVYGRAARSSSETRTLGAPGAASATRSSNRAAPSVGAPVRASSRPAASSARMGSITGQSASWTSTAFAPESSTWKRTSRSFERALIGFTTPPAFSVP